jgi:hypothetical protein
MKLNIELIRLLLIQQETGEKPDGLTAYPEAEQIYNLQLMEDAKLIVADLFIDESGIAKGAVIHRLTWAGHDFLDAVRDETIWKKAKEHVLRPGASWTFDVLKQWAKYELLTKLGVPTQ